MRQKIKHFIGSILLISLIVSLIYYIVINTNTKFKDTLLENDELLAKDEGPTIVADTPDSQKKVIARNWSFGVKHEPGNNTDNVDDKKAILYSDAAKAGIEREMEEFQGEEIDTEENGENEEDRESTLVDTGYPYYTWLLTNTGARTIYCIQKGVRNKNEWLFS